MRKDYIAIFLVVVAIILGIIFYFNGFKSENKNVLKYTAGCSSEKIDASVYGLRGDTSRIGAFISFAEVPLSGDVRTQLTELGVALKEDTWIFDYAIAEIPTESLCILAERDFVKGIFIPQTNN